MSDNKPKQKTKSRTKASVRDHIAAKLIASGCTQTSAFRRAGFAESSVQAGSFSANWFKRPAVKEILERYTAEYALKMNFTDDDIVSEFSRIAFNPETKIGYRIKCLENLARVRGMYTEKLELTERKHIDDVLSSCSDRELLEKAAELGVKTDKFIDFKNSG